MTTLLEQIKERTVELRKKIATAEWGVVDLRIERNVLVTLVSEATMIGKNDGNRETTDAETVAVIKKFIANLDATLEVLTKQLTTDPAEDNPALDKYNACRLERVTLESFLPTQLNEEQLTEIVKAIVKGANLVGPKSMGLVMKELKERYSGQYDGALASKVAKQVLGS